jgi:hypothetical protein
VRHEPIGRKMVRGQVSPQGEKEASAASSPCDSGMVAGFSGRRGGSNGHRGG